MDWNSARPCQPVATDIHDSDSDDDSDDSDGNDAEYGRGAQGARHGVRPGSAAPVRGAWVGWCNLNPG